MVVLISLLEAPRSPHRVVQEPLGQSTNLSQSLSTNKRGKVVKTKEKEEAATPRTTKSLKALTGKALALLEARS